MRRIYLSKRILAEDLQPGLTLGLLNADVTAYLRGRGLVKIRVSDTKHPLLSGFPNIFPIYHSDSFILKPYDEGNAKTIAVFDEPYKYEAPSWASSEQLKSLIGSPNIIVGKLGNGK